MAGLGFQQVSRTYPGNSVALSDISLEVADGEFFVVVGPSGCGKTTFLRILAGLENVSIGEVFMDGTRVNDLPPGSRNISMVFQNYALFPHMNVYDNIAFGLKIRKMPKDELSRRVDQTVDMLGLRGHTGKKPGELSGGQRQRVALGRAIVREPSAFLFDEPLSNLDAGLRGEMRTELLRLHRRLKTTMVYVTHDQVEAMTLADRICVLKEGRIQQIGTPESVYRRPRNRFVASFFGSPPMNMFRGVLKHAPDGYRLRLHGSEEVCLDAGAYESSSLERCSGREVSAGIRPNALLLERPATVAEHLDVTIDVTELIGDEKYIHGHTQSQDTVTAVLPSRQEAIPGEPCRFYFSRQAVHLFDAEGKRI